MEAADMTAIPVDEKLLQEIVDTLEGIARRSTNGEAATLGLLAGDLEATRARHASALRIQPSKAEGARLPLPPEERE